MGRLKPRPYYLEKYLTLDERLEAWKSVADKHFVKEYVKWVISHVREFFSIIDKRMEEVNAEDSDEFISAVQDRLGEVTIAHRLRMVQGVLRFFGLEPRFDIPRVREKSEERIKRKLISREEIDKMMAVCRSHGTEPSLPCCSRCA